MSLQSKSDNSKISIKKVRKSMSVVARCQNLWHRWHQQWSRDWHPYNVSELLRYSYMRVGLFVWFCGRLHRRITEYSYKNWKCEITTVGVFNQLKVSMARSSKTVLWNSRIRNISEAPFNAVVVNTVLSKKENPFLIIRSKIICLPIFSSQSAKREQGAKNLTPPSMWLLR